MIDYTEIRSLIEALGNQTSQIRTTIQNLFKQAIQKNPEIKSIRWTGQANSYSDEGYACEGLLCISTDEIDNTDISEEYGTNDDGDIPEGVWSQDKYYRLRKYNRETKNYETISVTSKLDLLAKELFDEVIKLANYANDWLEVSVYR